MYSSGHFHVTVYRLLRCPLFVSLVPCDAAMCGPCSVPPTEPHILHWSVLDRAFRLVLKFDFFVGITLAPWFIPCSKYLLGCFQVVLVRWNEPYQKLATCDADGGIFVWIQYEGRWSVELVNDRGAQVSGQESLPETRQTACSGHTNTFQ